jgi:AraC-like DNA-binding protein
MNGTPPAHKPSDGCRVYVVHLRRQTLGLVVRGADLACAQRAHRHLSFGRVQSLGDGGHPPPWEDHAHPARTGDAGHVDRLSADGEWIGVRFKLGTFMPHQPVGTLIDRRDVNLPDRSGRSFVLEGSSWEYPSFENAESFVRRLVRAGLVVRDPAVEAALQGDIRTLSRRSAQRHFLFATGMTQTTHRKIEQARYAVSLLRRGVPIADAIHDAGYYDQAHLTRSLRQLIGETPARVLRQERQLSFLYKTTPPGRR